MWLQKVLNGDKDTLAVRTALWGTYPWEEPGVCTPRLELYKADAEFLAATLQENEYSSWSEAKQVEWLRHVPKTHVTRVLGPESTCDPPSERSQRVVNGGSFCEICASWQRNPTAMGCHVWAAHRVSDPRRAMIKTPECIACGERFSGKYALSSAKWRF